MELPHRFACLVRVNEYLSEGHQRTRVALGCLLLERTVEGRFGTVTARAVTEAVKVA
jgi:hypothetical protein